MKLWEALKIHDETNRKIKGTEWDNYYSPHDLDRSVCTAMKIDWQVEPAKVEVTRETLGVIINKFWLSHDGFKAQDIHEFICKELGLGES